MNKAAVVAAVAAAVAWRLVKAKKKTAPSVMRIELKFIGPYTGPPGGNN